MSDYILNSFPAIALVAVYRVYHTIAWVDTYPVYRGSFSHCLPSQPRVSFCSGSLPNDWFVISPAAPHRASLYGWFVTRCPPSTSFAPKDTRSPCQCILSANIPLAPCCKSSVTPSADVEPAMADLHLASRRDLKRERCALFLKIDREGTESDMPCERCWKAKPQRRCVMLPGSNKCSGCVRLGKKCSGSNVADTCEWRRMGCAARTDV
jgi:hypothetical protein